ncbi:unnamed protein product, partial [Laminaria digitata]
GGLCVQFFFIKVSCWVRWGAQVNKHPQKKIWCSSTRSPAPTINSFGLVGVACTVACPVADFFFSSRVAFKFVFFCVFFVLARWLRVAGTWYIQGTNTERLLCSLHVQLATPAGFQVNHNKSRRGTL